MGILSDIKERRNLNLTDAESWHEAGIIQRSAAGVRVTPNSALKSSAVFACVRVLAGSMGQMPLLVYERSGDDQRRERATDYYLYDILKTNPNPHMTSFHFRVALQGHLATWGNAYAEIEWSQGGRVLGLWPLRPDKMEDIETAGDSLLYKYRLPSGEPVTLPGRNVLHLRFMSADGIVGRSPVALHRQGIGLGLAAEEFGARFFGNDARPGGVLQHPGKLSDEAHQHLKESWESRHQGLSRAHRMAILEEGMTYEEIGIPPEDAQYIQLRKFQKSEIAGIYGVPPHMIADLERATFSNIEHQGIEFVVHTLGPWLVCWEQGLDKALLTEAERRRYYTEFLVEGLLRGDSQARANFYSMMFNIGAFSQNDIRRLENENPIEGGDTYFVPLNMIPAEQAAQGFGPGDEDVPRSITFDPPGQDPYTVRLTNGNAPEPDTQEYRTQRSVTARYRLQQAQRRVYRDVAARLLRREANDIGNAAERFLNSRNLTQFDQWLREFYEDYPGVVVENMMPVARAYAEMVAQEAAAEVGVDVDEARLAGWVDSYVQNQAARHVAFNESRLREIMVTQQEDLLGALEEELETWREEPAAERIAQQESVRLNGAASKFVYLLAGTTALRWVAVGENCPYCSALNGRTISITEHFITKGQEFQPEGAERPLTTSTNVGHPPAHGGCDCLTAAARV